MRSLFADRDFRLLAVGQTLSALGDYAMFLALGVWAKELTGSNTAAGLTILPFALPALAGPALGVFVDRLPRRQVMIWSDVAAAIAVTSLVAVDGPEDMWLIYVVSFVSGTIVTIYQAARAGLLRGMLDDDALGDGNGLLQATNQGMRLVAPLVGAGLFAVFGGPAVAVLDAATFVISAVFLAALRARDIERRREPLRWIAEIREGLGHIAASADLVRLTIGTAIVTLLFGCTEVLIYAVVDEGLGRPPEFIGVLATLQGVGAVAGGAVAGKVLRRWGELPTIAAACAVAGVGMVAFGSAVLPFVVGACIGFGVAVALFIVAYETLMQRRTPEALQGRVMAAVEAAVTLPYVVSIAIGAVIVSIVPFQLVYAIGGAGAVITSVYFLRGRARATTTV